MRRKWGLIVLFFLAVIFVGFWLSGGRSLFTLYRNYISQDISDKKYRWQDFIDRGHQEEISGFYAYGDSVS